MMKVAYGNRVRIWANFVGVQGLSMEELLHLEETGVLEEEEEEDFNSFGPYTIPSRKPNYKRVTLQIKLDYVETITIVTKAFVWTYPWIRCLLSVYKGRGGLETSIKRGFFEPLTYEINDNPGIDSIRSFLSSANISDKLAFEDYLKTQPQCDVRPSQLWTLLHSWSDERSVVLQEYVSKSPEGRLLSLSQIQPQLFKYGSLLFKNKFLSLLDKSDPSSPSETQDEILSQLESHLTSSYWALGFNDVLYKNTGYSGLEVKLNSLKLTSLYDKLEQLHRHALEIYDGFKSYCYRDGHTYLTRTNVAYLSKGCRNLEDILNFLKKHKVIEIDDLQQTYQLSRFKQAEDRMVSNLKSLLREPPWKIDFEPSAFGGLTPDKEQEKAARMIARNPITIISGRGGTGKTEIVTSVLSTLNVQSEVEEPSKGSENSGGKGESVLYVAPTGKAASVIRHRIKDKAYTIHQILASHKKFLLDESTTWKYSSVKVLVVDECSMVGLCLFSHLLNILRKDAQLKKIVLLGDVLQLPSIDPGNLMSDLFECLKPHGYSIELLTNHRSEGTLIFENAKRISQKKMPVFDDENSFHLIEPIWEECDLSQRCLTLKNLFRNVLIKENVDQMKINAYLKLLVEKSKDMKVDCQNTSQIITFTRKECEILNQICCKIYNNHFIESYYNGRKVKTFVEYDKVMCTKNKDVALLTIDNDVIVKKKEERLMNGSVFVIDSLKTYDQRLQNSENKEKECSEDRGQLLNLCYELNDLLGDAIYVEKREFDKLCKPFHAWALTIHKFQGSETNTIVYGVSSSRNENWKHVYTAITRGRKKVIIVGSKAHLEAAILRDSKPRQTKLKSLMNDVILTSLPRQSDIFPSDDELEGFSSDEWEEAAPTPNKHHLEHREVNSSLWEANASFEVMMSQMVDEEDTWKIDGNDNNVTPPNSPSKKPKTSSDLTPTLNSKLKLFE